MTRHEDTNNSPSLRTSRAPLYPAQACSERPRHPPPPAYGFRHASAARIRGVFPSTGPLELGTDSVTPDNRKTNGEKVGTRFAPFPTRPSRSKGLLNLPLVPVEAPERAMYRERNIIASRYLMITKGDVSFGAFLSWTKRAYGSELIWIPLSCEDSGLLHSAVGRHPRDYASLADDPLYRDYGNRLYKRDVYEAIGQVG
ncbi:MAG: hypothetical protein BJ554DRAFT_7439 [Olpidium bornovanus]|uniref:Uncharacterized protein n=1 Tax=Olpidium bornovanus TaxID=278681 RepID=A0A8H8DJF6_9FUNG|nr:MAG: hypothetical protein BJ554DRAFT_7439 [Olpidium bornovanus]